MKTIFHDKESGTKLEMEGTFRNSKAQLVDDEGNVLIESEGSYLEILEMFNQLSGEENEQLCEDTAEDEEKLTKDDFRDSRVKVLEDITDECGDTLDKGTITTDVNVLYGDNLLINRVIVEPKDFKKLEILTDEQKNIQPDELFVVNNDEMDYYLEFEKGEVIRFLSYGEDDFSLIFENSKGVEQLVEYEDVTLLENQEGNKLRFNFCYENDILFTEDTSLKGTKVNLTKQSSWIEDDGSLIINTDCDDGIPYIKSNKSGYGAFVDLSKLKLRTKEYTQSLEIGDYVKVKEGKECGGAKGFAIVADTEENNIYLKGIDADGKYRETWINNVNNVIKIG